MSAVLLLLMCLSRQRCELDGFTVVRPAPVLVPRLYDGLTTYKTNTQTKHKQQQHTHTHVLCHVTTPCACGTPCCDVYGLMEYHRTSLNPTHYTAALVSSLAPAPAQSLRSACNNNGAMEPLTQQSRATGSENVHSKIKDK